MQKIKFFKKDNHNFARIGGQEYKGYTVGNMPAKFAFIYNEDEDKEGITEWFNYKGLTYVEVKESMWTQIAKDNERMNIEMLFDCMN